jgi:HK97 family phage portal protein
MSVPRTSSIPGNLDLAPVRGFSPVRKAEDAEPLIQRKPPTVNPEALRYEDAFERNAWIYRAVIAKASNIGEVPLKVTRLMADGSRQDDNSPNAQAILKLMNRPNSKMAGNDLLEAIVITKNLRQCLLWMSWGAPEDGKPGTKTPPKNLFVLPAHKTFAKTDQNKLMGWQVRDTQTFIPAWQVIQLAFYNPRDPYRGLPPASAAFQSADTDYALEIHHANFFENGMKLSGMISFDDPLTEERRVRVEAMVDALTGVGNAHSIITLDNKAKFQSMIAEQKDMDFKNLSEKNRDKVGASFGVPRLVFGDPIDANRTTAEVSRKMFWLDVLLPEMRDIEDQLNANLVHPYYDETLYLEFDRSKIEALSENRTEFSTAFFSLMQGLALGIGASDGSGQFLTAAECREILREHFGLNLDEEMESEPDPTADDTTPAKPDTPPAADPNANEDTPVNDNPKSIVRTLKNSALSRVRQGLPAISRERTQSLLQRRGSSDKAEKVTIRLAELMNAKLTSPEAVEKFFEDLEKKVA